MASAVEVHEGHSEEGGGGSDGDPLIASAERESKAGGWDGGGWGW